MQPATTQRFVISSETSPIRTSSVMVPRVPRRWRRAFRFEPCGGARLDMAALKMWRRSTAAVMGAQSSLQHRSPGGLANWPAFYFLTSMKRLSPLDSHDISLQSEMFSSKTHQSALIQRASGELVLSAPHGTCQVAQRRESAACCICAYHRDRTSCFTHTVPLQMRQTHGIPATCVWRTPANRSAGPEGQLPA
jgi:hypothetical protein